MNSARFFVLLGGTVEKKSEALKRVPVSSIEEVVDEAMAYIPKSFDISVPENRMIVRNWMVRVCGVVATNNAESFARAAESAIQEAAALAINPDFYASRKLSREKRKAQRAMMQNRDKPKNRAEIAFARLTDAPVKM